MKSVSRLLFVGFEGIRWDVLRALSQSDVLPAFSRLIDTGAVGRLNATYPLFPERHWADLFAVTTDHGILCPLDIDALPARRAVGAATWKAPPVWEYLARKGYNAHSIGFPGTHPSIETGGVVVSNLFFERNPWNGADLEILPDCISPLDCADTLRGLVVSSDEIDQSTLGLFISGNPKGPGPDLPPHVVAGHLASEFTAHAMATWAIEHHPWDFAAVRYRLVDTFSHMCARLGVGLGFREDTRPSRLVESAYRLADMLLHNLLRLVGEETAVIVCSPHSVSSDNGSGAQSLGYAMQGHGPDGLALLSCPGLIRDELFHGARLSDIGATIYHLLGAHLPPHAKGRVLQEVFVDPRPLKIDHAPVHRRLPRLPNDSESRHLVPEELRSAPRADIDRVCLELKAHAAYSSGDVRTAALHFARLHDTWPFRYEYGMRRAELLFLVGMVDEAAGWAKVMVDSWPDAAVNDFLKGVILYHDDHQEAGERLLRAFSERMKDSPYWQLMVGRVFLAFGAVHQARSLLGDLVAGSPEFTDAKVALAQASFAAGDIESATQLALAAVRSDYSNANAHLALGSALWKSGDRAGARTALEAACKLAPSDPFLHRLLSRVSDVSTVDHHLHNAFSHVLQSSDIPLPDEVRPVGEPSRTSRTVEVSGVNRTVKVVLPEDLPAIIGHFEFPPPESAAVIAVSSTGEAESLAHIHSSAVQGATVGILSIQSRTQGPPERVLIRAARDYARDQGWTVVEYDRALEFESTTARRFESEHFVPTRAFEEYLLDTTESARVLSSTAEKLRGTSVIPENGRIVGLSEGVNLAAVRALVRRHVHGQEGVLERGPGEGIDYELSFAAFVGEKLVGTILSRKRPDCIECPFLVVETGGRWSLPLMMLALANACLPRGHHSILFCTSKKEFPHMHALAQRLGSRSRVKKAFFRWEAGER